MLRNIDELSAEAKVQIQALSPSKVLIMGGTATISAGVESAIAAAAPAAAVARFRESDRCATSIEAYRSVLLLTDDSKSGRAAGGKPSTASLPTVLSSLQTCAPDSLGERYGHVRERVRDILLLKGRKPSSFPGAGLLRSPKMASIPASI